jgi:dTDP-4-dehydrorhamnose 3,5-epimerase
VKKLETALPDVYILEPKLFGDERGWFMETYSRAAFEQLGITCVFVQDNHSFTARKGTLRGLHFQNDPMAQTKLVRVLRGKVLDVAADVRKGSPNYLKWVSLELSAENRRMLLIPRGFAHGFLTLTENVEFAYKVDNPYSPFYDRSIRFNDPAIGVDWGEEFPVLSEKDENAPLLKDSDCNFVYGRGGEPE